MIVTYVAQSHGGAVTDLAVRPLSWRAANAVISYAKYLFLTFWPRDLALLYPASRDTAPFWQWSGVLLLLVGITVVAVRFARQKPYLIVGWLFFLLTLVPVIGFVRIGSQAMADRYSYIPSIGLFVAVIFGVADIAKTWRIPPMPMTLISSGLIGVLAFLTARQVHRWRDSETLFQYVLSVTSDNAVIHYNLGCVLQQQGKDAEAVTHFAEAVRIKPRYGHALANLGLTLRKQGKAAEAISIYERALEVEPESVKVHWQFGEVLEQQGKNDDALEQFHQAVKLAPADPRIRTDLGVKLARGGKFAEAAEQFAEAIRLDPNNAEAHDDLGLVFLSTGDPVKALEEFNNAYRLNPNVSGLEDNLRRARGQIDREKQ
jgi:tetratricopeptide (TPR) repeat protein